MPSPYCGCVAGTPRQIVGKIPTMAYVVGPRDGSWEIRESVATPGGPRSRTLATFRELSPEVVERAVTRASKPVDREALRRAAARSGAPLVESNADRAAQELAREIASQRSAPSPRVARLLRGLLEVGEPQLSDAARSAAEWVGAPARERGRALYQLLELTDSLPVGRRPDRSSFPRLESRPA